ncbi:undecaprenyldiphospho-muramoylpentapeptide beta-N-acetylglucosaminyltransferase [Paenibacillus albiflavus]|uniref:UDP-N-acetylglucosamine--N-acetylmuramyl-(pentapeptide) pyrophosphoryl-undecaprenol N-acetylglucosamine transferase n=1 Tax=Paenibacillus albiflavus TaxID=2545760 RepID=A0A4R4EKC2_9BACL|nr:undecaprenyldiphospho-muramoylpentapeptide beta-N-acetylglucosaminyltransferase [Paenibacillus albiflavus]TCZ79903.1 undecaprenyldiphospho-muramoylpentapeptide beta-N-acetylglucosaminyltransferase [Paenibacillus albiflavus]
MKRTIVMTGGGSAGHVTVNLALIPHFSKDGWDIHYIGSYEGIERQLISRLDKVHYHAISTGKLRRYLDWNHLKDPFKVIKGCYQAYRLIRKIKPDVIFSKGGFVAVPVVVAGWLNKIPVIMHESDLTPGLANRISFPLAEKLCVTFPETVEQLASPKAVYVGAIVREEIMHGDREQGMRFSQMQRVKPIIMVMGGSLGASSINQAVRTHLHTLLQRYQIIHICGKGNLDPSHDAACYKQYEYVNEELADLLAITDIMISRAGSNSIFEFVSLHKPMLLIPLPKESSRGDQILNAESFAKAGYCEVLADNQLSGDLFVKTIDKLYDNRFTYIQEMKKYNADNNLNKLISIIKNHAKRK